MCIRDSHSIVLEISLEDGSANDTDGFIPTEADTTSAQAVMTESALVFNFIAIILPSIF